MLTPAGVLRSNDDFEHTRDYTFLPPYLICVKDVASQRGRNRVASSVWQIEDLAAGGTIIIVRRGHHVESWEAQLSTQVHDHFYIISKAYHAAWDPCNGREYILWN